MEEKLKGVIVNFPKLGGKSPTELLMGRSRSNLYQSSGYSPEYEIGRHDGIENQPKDLERTRRSSTRKTRLKRGVEEKV